MRLSTAGVILVFSAGAVAGGVAYRAAAGPRSPVVGAATKSSPVASEIQPVSGSGLPEAPAVAAPVTATVPVIESALQSTVSIRAGKSYGAGVLIDGKGAVLTALHVVEGASRIRLRFHDSGWQYARLVARDPDSDLALLMARPGDRPPAPLGTATSVEVGDMVLTIGSPRDLSFSVSRGMVSFAGRKMKGARWLQTDLPANPGSSGGPIFDDRGRVIGVMSFVLRNSQGLSFAIPIDYALEQFGDKLSRPVGDLSAFRAWRDGDTP